GIRLPVHGQPLQILELLLRSPRQLVSREQFRQALWPNGTFVEFNDSLNASVRRLRHALEDEADQPRFIETLPRRGYRFLGEVEVITGNDGKGAVAPPSSPAGPKPAKAPQVLRRILSLSHIGYALVTLVALAIGAGSVYPWRGKQAAGAAQPIRSIAVLPLENLSGDPGQEYFADGITDALITDLAKIGSLLVISRTSVMQYKTARKSLPQVARELDVDAVLEGSVTRVGSKVRITAQLIRASSDTHLWAEEYERDMQDFLGLQRDVARDIAYQVKGKLSEDEKHPASLRPLNPAAQEAYLRGNFFLNKRTPAGNKAALEYFQQAIALDPEYALPYAGLADYYLMGGSKGNLDSEGYSRLRAAAEKAIALDPSLAEPHAALGRGAAHQGHGSEAEKHFQTALQLNPNLATAHEWYGMFLNWRGHFEQGLEEFKQALALDPASAHVNARVGQGLTFMRRYDEAIVQLKKALEMDPNLWITHSILGDAYLGKGMFNEAIVEYRRSLAT